MVLKRCLTVITRRVGTVIGMHMREEHCKIAEQHHMNVVIAGHISSDSIGMNIL